MIPGLMALVVASFYAGAALYVNVVEQKALAALDDRGMLTAWKISVGKGFLMQAPLCVIGFLLGALAWWQTRLISEMIGALAMLANVPWTTTVIVPINNQLHAANPGAQSSAILRALMKRWASAHSVRTALGLLAIVAFFQAVMPGK